MTRKSQKVKKWVRKILDRGKGSEMRTRLARLRAMRLKQNVGEHITR